MRTFQWQKYTAAGLPPQRQGSWPGWPAPQPHVLVQPLAHLLSCLFKGANVSHRLNVGLVTPVYNGRGSRADTVSIRHIVVAEPIMRLYAASINRRLIESQRTGSRVLITRLNFVLLCRCRIKFSFYITSSASSRLVVNSSLSAC